MSLEKRKKSYLLCLALNLYIYSFGVHAEINVVAAETVYGSVAKELGGPYVQVTTILSNPNQDPHLFTLTPSTMLAAKRADILIFNGAAYDPWMSAIVNMKSSKERAVIEIAQLMQVQEGADPHIWYLPETLAVFAKNVVQVFSHYDPQHRLFFEEQLHYFNQDYHRVLKKIQQLKKTFPNAPIIATEPVLNYLTQRLGFKMHGEAFQRNMMNDVPPTITQIKSFEDDLRKHRVCLLIYNKQVMSSETKRMMALAQAEKIPLVSVSEIMPRGLRYSQWILMILDQLETALQKSFLMKTEERSSVCG